MQARPVSALVCVHDARYYLHAPPQALTDPDLNAWFEDSSGMENADKARLCVPPRAHAATLAIVPCLFA